MIPLLDEITKIVSKSAPLLGSLLGSPAAGIGIGWIASFFDIKTEDTAALLNKLSNDPEIDLKLKQLESQNNIAIQTLLSKDYEKTIEDREDARKREEFVLQTTGKYDWVQHACALIAVSGFFVFLFTIDRLNLTHVSHDILYTLLGVLGTTFTQIYQYYFGASRN